MQVAFQLDGVDQFRQQGWSVLVPGALHRVDPDVADFRERFDPQPWIIAERDAWLVVDPFAITGRRLHAAEPERCKKREHARCRYPVNTGVFLGPDANQR
jgi:hypothetical protein